MNVVRVILFTTHSLTLSALMSRVYNIRCTYSIIMYFIFYFFRPLETLIIIIIPFIAHRGGGNGPLRCPDDVYKGVAIFTLHRVFDVFFCPRYNYLGIAVIMDREACFMRTRTCLIKTFFFF